MVAELKTLVESTSDVALLDRLKYYHVDTYTHSYKVAYVSVILASAMSLDKELIVDIATASLLHDVGKLAIPLSILTKPGKLSDTEYDMVKNHSMYGYLLTEEYNERVRNGILTHHVSYGSKSYPDVSPTFVGDLIHIADVYSALSSNRSYKKCMSLSDCMLIMQNERESYNKEIFKTFEKIFSIEKKKGDTL